MHRFFSFAIAVLLAGILSSPGRAADAPKPAAANNPPPGTSVEMPILIAPMVVDGNLLAYAYVTSIIVATSPPAAVEVRARVPFIQDAFVRDVNGPSIVDKNTPDQVDKAALGTRLLATARRVVGPGKVAEVRISAIKISPMRPAGEQPPGP
ncbi:MAG: hypothetical protein KGL26_02030 [Pseudomonadota bacterium]|nr:hypothetical protein [Pseudomonadota bacterium]